MIEMAIDAAVPQPAAVEMIMPSTSPIAQPVRQCSVAEVAVLQEWSRMCSRYPGGYMRQARVRRVDIAERQRAFEDAFLSPLAVRSYPADRRVPEPDSPSHALPA